MQPISKNILSNKKVFVGMSGGVDSSVSAALLKEQGYDVTGVYIRTWQPDWLPCTWRDERRDAMRVAAKLDIPFITIDCEKEYKEKVADYMISEYKAGRTPNPDIMCNKEVKFGSFLQQALAKGADFVATGHYAQNINRKLFEGADKEKDQSYFLWTLTEKELKHVLFPVGHLQKKEVRELARKFDLPTAEKKDSQGICFIGDVDMKDFLRHYIKEKKGRVINTKNKTIGTHQGVWFFTIGERHGFTITEKSPQDMPYYVVAKDIAKNTITVSQKAPGTLSGHGISTATLSNVVLRNPLLTDVGFRARYRQPIQAGKIEKVGENLVVHFKKPQDGVSVGQSVVIYRDEECLGGGIITETHV